MKKILRIVMASVLVINLFSFADTVGNINISYAGRGELAGDTTDSSRVTYKEIQRYLNKSVFVGNSLGADQRLFFRSRGKKFGLRPRMLVRVSYSFYNDKHGRTPWLPIYKGQPVRAKVGIKRSGAKRVFINMGSNDIYTTGKRCSKDYIEYIKGIKRANPKVVIFIQSTTPVRNLGNKRRGFNNRNINQLNRYIKRYCDSQKDMYYIDVNTPLKGSDGSLMAKYCSDGYYHISFAGYRVWTKALIKDIRKLLAQEKSAGNSIAKLKRNLTEENYNEAKKVVLELKSSSNKDLFLKELRSAKKKIQNDKIFAE